MRLTNVNEIGQRNLDKPFLRTEGDLTHWIVELCFVETSSVCLPFPRSI